MQTRKLGRVDAALGHESGEAAAHVGVGGPDGDHEIRVVDPGRKRPPDRRRPVIHLWSGLEPPVPKPTVGPPSLQTEPRRLPTVASEGAAARTPAPRACPPGCAPWDSTTRTDRVRKTRAHEPHKTEAQARVGSVLRATALLKKSKVAAGPEGGEGAPPGFDIKEGGLGSAAQALALATLCGVLFLTFLDNTVVSVGLANVQSDLHAGVTSLQWVVNGYALTFASFMLAAGMLGDILGRKRIMLVGVAVFCGGSVVAALAGNVDWLIAGRVIMGIGAAASEPGHLSIIRHVTRIGRPVPTRSASGPRCRGSHWHWDQSSVASWSAFRAGGPSSGSTWDLESLPSSWRLLRSPRPRTARGDGLTCWASCSGPRSWPACRLE